MSEDIIARIDRAIGCQQCARALRPDGPSPDFCSEPCQRAWHSERAENLLPEASPIERMLERHWAQHPHNRAATESVSTFVQDALNIRITDWQRAYMETMYAARPPVAGRRDALAGAEPTDLEVTIQVDRSAFDRAFGQLLRRVSDLIRGVR